MCANVRKCGQLLKKKVKNMLIIDFFTPKSWLSEKKTIILNTCSAFSNAGQMKSRTTIKRMTDTIPIPVSEDGKYDFQKQKELADKYEQIEEIKRSIAQKILTLSEIIVL